MSMALCLEFTQKWFREKYNWSPNQCGVQYNSLPAYNAGSFYISIDDAGVDTGQQSTNSLKEILKIKIGIWKRRRHHQKSKIGQMKLPQDKYLAGSWTLAELERKVIVAKRNAQFGLHQNWQYMNDLNEFYQLPNNENGADFRYTFYYRGRSGMLSTVLSGEGSGGTTNYIEWYGYTLDFAGLAREQYIHDSTRPLA